MGGKKRPRAPSPLDVDVDMDVHHMIAKGLLIPMDEPDHEQEIRDQSDVIVGEMKVVQQAEAATLEEQVLLVP